MLLILLLTPWSRFQVQMWVLLILLLTLWHLMSGISNNHVMTFLIQLSLKFWPLAHHKRHLTFKGQMLDISNTACTPHLPNVRYIEHHTCIKFFRAHGVYLSKKHKQTHCGSHNRAWNSWGATMSFMAVGGPGFNIIYVHTWPLGISSGSDRQDTVDHCLRLKRRTSKTKSCS